MKTNVAFWQKTGLVFSTLIFMAYALALGGLGGIWSAQWALEGEYPISKHIAGPWTMWPNLGSADIDPYALAILGNNGEIPLGLGEGLTLHASIDSSGWPLDSRCTYRIGNDTPQTRYWTITAYGRTGMPIVSDLKRSGFTSSEIVREESGRFSIFASPNPMPGNWLQLSGEPSVMFVLRLYETPVSTNSFNLKADALPTITRLGCAA